MSKERELLRVALEFLDPRSWIDPEDIYALTILSSEIEELLAQPEQEPVAWMYEWINDAEQLTYESILLALRSAEAREKDFYLHKLERFIAVVNIRINKAIPQGWEIP